MEANNGDNKSWNLQAVLRCILPAFSVSAAVLLAWGVLDQDRRCFCRDPIKVLGPTKCACMSMQAVRAVILLFVIVLHAVMMGGCEKRAHPRVYNQNVGKDVVL